MKIMVEAMVVCPSTGRAVRTGFVFGNLAAFDAVVLQSNTVLCTECGEKHLVNNSTVKAFPKER